MLAELCTDVLPITVEYGPPELTTGHLHWDRRNPCSTVMFWKCLQICIIHRPCYKLLEYKCSWSLWCKYMWNINMLDKKLNQKHWRDSFLLNSFKCTKSRLLGNCPVEVMSGNQSSKRRTSYRVVNIFKRNNNNLPNVKYAF